MFLVAIVVFGIAFAYYASMLSQRNAVKSLQKLGGTIPSQHGPINRVQVWYSHDVSFDKSEERFKFDFSTTSDWIVEHFGRDFQSTPSVIEIHPPREKGKPSLTQEMIEKIHQMRGVRQIWISKLNYPDGTVNNEHEKLSQWFPDLIVASPQ